MLDFNGARTSSLRCSKTWICRSSLGRSAAGYPNLSLYIYIYILLFSVYYYYYHYHHHHHIYIYIYIHMTIHIWLSVISLSICTTKPTHRDPGVRLLCNDFLRGLPRKGPGSSFPTYIYIYREREIGIYIYIYIYIC